MKFHVVADAHGELLAWIKATPETPSGPKLVLLPEDPTHILHENVEIDTEVVDRKSLMTALKKALANRQI